MTGRYSKAEQKAQLVKCLSCTPEDLSSDPWTHAETSYGSMYVASAGEGGEAESSWSPIKSAWLNGWAAVQWVTMLPKRRWKAAEEWPLVLTSDLCMCTHVPACSWIYERVHTPPTHSPILEVIPVNEDLKESLNKRAPKCALTAETRNEWSHLYSAIKKAAVLSWFI